MITPCLVDRVHLVAIRADGTVDGPTLVLSADDRRTCQAMATLYRTSGFHPPWIGYVSVVGDRVVGGGAFVGPPADNRVEIAYYTAAAGQQRGYATLTARRLVRIALEAAPNVELFAKTEPRPNASTKILSGLGFAHAGSTTDHEIGEAWVWRLKT